MSGTVLTDPQVEARKQDAVVLAPFRESSVLILKMMKFRGSQPFAIINCELCSYEGMREAKALGTRC